MSPSVQWLHKCLQNGRYNYPHSGRKLHLQHGPIDLIIEISGTSADDEQAGYQRAIDRFDTVLTELVAELPALRTRTDVNHCLFKGAIAKRMWRAARDCEHWCVSVPQRLERKHRAPQHLASTPMIAVAGSVADEVLTAIIGSADDLQRLNKVSVNNGGDIAIWLDRQSGYRVGVVTNPDDARITASLALLREDGIGGVATSGWRGRSYSMGIADSVTVLAANAAVADAAATLIANAVNYDSLNESLNGACQSEFIERKPANELDPDTDLGDALVLSLIHI